MIQVSIQAMLRLNFHNDVTQEQIKDIVQALESITDPTVERCKGLEDSIKNHALEFIINPSNKAVILSNLKDINLWVNDDVSIDKF